MREPICVPACLCGLALLVVGCDDAPGKAGRAPTSSAAPSAVAASPSSSPTPSSSSSSSLRVSPKPSSSAASKKPPTSGGEAFDEWPLTRQKGEAIALPAGDGCTSPKSSAAWQSKAVAKVPPRSVELVDTGKEPRKALRYSLVAGTLVERRMKTDSGDGGEPDWRGGNGRSLFARVRCADSGGAARVEVSLDDPSFINTQWFVVSSRGVVERMGTGAARGEELATPEATSAAMMFAPTPLPEEEVGLGAVWRVKYQVANDMTQVEEHRLVSLEGSEVRTQLSISQKRTPKVAAHQLESTGKGAHRIDLQAPLDARWRWTGKPKLMFFGLMLGPTPPEVSPP